MPCRPPNVVITIVVGLFLHLISLVAISSTKIIVSFVCFASPGVVQVGTLLASSCFRLQFVVSLPPRPPPPPPPPPPPRPSTPFFCPTLLGPLCRLNLFFFFHPLPPSPPTLLVFFLSPGFIPLDLPHTNGTPTPAVTTTSTSLFFLYPS